MKAFRTIFLFAILLLMGSSSNAQGTFVLSNSTTQAKHVFSLTFEKENDLTYIKICKQGSADDCHQSNIPLIGEFDFSVVAELAQQLLKSNWAADLDDKFVLTQPDLDRLRSIYEYWRARDLENTIRYLQETSPAGVITLTDEYITLIKDDEQKCCSINEQNEIKARIGETVKENTPVLKVENVAFTISDNFITKITITGEVIQGNKKFKILKTNRVWSLSLRKNDNQIAYVFSEKTTGNNVNEWKLCYCELFRYIPHAPTGAYSFYVKDAEFSLAPGESKVLSKRTLDEYIGINISSDFLGINNNNANNFLTTDVNAVLPLMVEQSKACRFVPFAAANLSFTVLDGANGKNELLDVRLQPAKDTNSQDTLYVDYFDLLRFHNINTDLHVSLMGVEIKMASLNFHLVGGLEFYRTGLRYSVVKDGQDSVIEFGAFSMAPYARFLAQYRPELKFGADLKIDFWKRMVMMNLENSGPTIFDSKGAKDGIFTPIKEGKDRRLFSTELDLYAHMGGRSGLFARLGMDVTGFGPHNNIFPRIQVGYSTNLDAYINSVQKKDD